MVNKRCEMEWCKGTLRLPSWRQPDLGGSKTWTPVTRDFAVSKFAWVKSLGLS